MPNVTSTPPFIFETSRLRLREITPDDAEQAYALNADPEVLRYTGDQPFASVPDAKEFLRNYSDYRDNGFGRWAMIRTTDNRFLGWCGLKRDRTTGEVDIGFRLFRDCWNQGYASESASACLRYGFFQLSLDTIVGRAMRANTASVRVLEKIGLSYSHDFDFDGQPGVVYQIRRSTV